MTQQKIDDRLFIVTGDTWVCNWCFAYVDVKFRLFRSEFLFSLRWNIISERPNKIAAFSAMKMRSSFTSGSLDTYILIQNCWHLRMKHMVLYTRTSLDCVPHPPSQSWRRRVHWILNDSPLRRIHRKWRHSYFDIIIVFWPQLIVAGRSAQISCRFQITITIIFANSLSWEEVDEGFTFGVGRTSLYTHI